MEIKLPERKSVETTHGNWVSEFNKIRHNEGYNQALEDSMPYIKELEAKITELSLVIALNKGTPQKESVCDITPDELLREYIKHMENKQSFYNGIDMAGINGILSFIKSKWPPQSNFVPSLEGIAEVLSNQFIVDGTWKNLSSWDKYRMAKDFKSTRCYAVAEKVYDYLTKGNSTQGEK